MCDEGTSVPTSSFSQGARGAKKKITMYQVDIESPSCHFTGGISRENHVIKSWGSCSLFNGVAYWDLKGGRILRWPFFIVVMKLLKPYSSYLKTCKVNLDIAGRETEHDVTCKAAYKFCHRTLI